MPEGSLGPRWRPISEGWGLLAPMAGAALLAAATRPRLSLAPLVGCAVVWQIFRDPEREVRARPTVALAPADGFVVRVERVWDDYWAQEMTEIGIFLALWDVHIQRSPVDGAVVEQRRRDGGNLPAFGKQAALNNTQLSSYLRSGDGVYTVTQITGLIARRIVSWAREGDRLQQGERMGMIKLGSQVTLRVPRGAEVLVQPGKRVEAGLTPVADISRVMAGSAAGSA